MERERRLVEAQGRDAAAGQALAEIAEQHLVPARLPLVAIATAGALDQQHQRERPGAVRPTQDAAERGLAAAGDHRALGERLRVDERRPVVDRLRDHPVELAVDDVEDVVGEAAVGEGRVDPDPRRVGRIGGAVHVDRGADRADRRGDRGELLRLDLGGDLRRVQRERVRVLALEQMAGEGDRRRDVVDRRRGRRRGRVRGRGRLGRRGIVVLARRQRQRERDDPEPHAGIFARRTG